MEKSHHADLIYSGSVESEEIKNIGGECHELSFERFGIDDSRELVRRAYNRPSESDLMTLVVRTSFITLEAQNALLKVLEEPPVSTKFIFVLPQDFIVLPTLLSRFNIVVEKNKASQSNEVFDEFLKSDIKDRLAAIDKSAKNKDSDWQRAIKQGLISHLYSSSTDKSVESLEYAARTLLTRGASNKMLLEHAALILSARS